MLMEARSMMMPTKRKDPTIRGKRGRTSLLSTCLLMEHEHGSCRCGNEKQSRRGCSHVEAAHILQVRKKVLLLKKQLIKNLLMCLRSTRMLWTLNLKAIISAWQKSNRSRKWMNATKCLQASTSWIQSVMSKDGTFLKLNYWEDSQVEVGYKDLVCSHHISIAWC
ncbi:unnamed protein product [Urochloa humidicola]